MKTQHPATQGLFRSPIRANFQNVPKKPVLFLSKIEGAILRMYVQVQIKSKTTTSNDWKLKIADIVYKVLNSLQFLIKQIKEF